MGKLFHYFYNKGCKVEEYSETKRTLIMTASDETVDRYNEVMKIGKGKKDGALLENYNNNKIHLWNHNMWDSLPPIAKGMWARKVDIERKGVPMRALRVKLEFMPNEFGMSIHWMHTHPEDSDDKFLNGISIGFLPMAGGYRQGDELTPEEQKAGVSRVYDNWELLETSSVPIPCNPNALSDAFKGGRIPETVYRDFMHNTYKGDPVIHYKTFIIGGLKTNEGSEEEPEENAPAPEEEPTPIPEPKTEPEQPAEPEEPQEPEEEAESSEATTEDRKDKGGLLIQGKDLIEILGEEKAQKVVAGEMDFLEALDSITKKQTDSPEDDIDLENIEDESDPDIDIESVEDDSKPPENSDGDIPLTDEDVKEIISSVKGDSVGEFRKAYRKHILGIID